MEWNSLERLELESSDLDPHGSSQRCRTGGYVRQVGRHCEPQNAAQEPSFVEDVSDEEKELLAEEQAQAARMDLILT